MNSKYTWNTTHMEVGICHSAFHWNLPSGDDTWQDSFRLISFAGAP